MTFPTQDQIRALQAEFGTPLYVYDQSSLERAAGEVLGFPNAYGLTARYAMKALSTGAIIRVLAQAGLHIDASSGYEAERAIRAGVAPERIQITAQQLPADLKGLVERGVGFNACSLRQLQAFGQIFPGREISVRINPGLGSGHNNRTNVGGPSSSFGIWHEHLDEVLALQREFDLRLTGMHTHIGSGSDPVVWERCARMSLDIAAQLPGVQRLSLGGGFKVARAEGETPTDLQAIGRALLPDFEAFADAHGRELHLEIEPGTYLVANAGWIVASVIDVVDTGANGYRFIKTDTGMTELLRPNLYGAQHPIEIVPADGDENREISDYLVAGHCCESGDVITPRPGDPEGLLPRELAAPQVGDALVIGGAGAYCSSLAGKNYNSFPEAAEVLISRDGTPRLVRRRQTLDQMLANEVLD
ncbi:MAG: diaminopimelate decarboxylase [Deltaproteobacteria bacterium]|jgi:diaminopimelate decarboxylase|nr:diaminopimelate decarboxylase [Deltaproteobacteria bacterium]